MTNILIAFTNLCFAATLETAPTLAGPWQPTATLASTCAEAKAFTVAPTNPAGFFRLRLHDNGLVPTPGNPFALVVTNAVWLSAPLVFNCQDDPMSFYRWTRDGAVITNRAGRSDIIDVPPPGIHTYQVQAVDQGQTSWWSTAVCAETK